MDANNKRLIKQSTKAFYQEGKITEDYSLYDFLHGYLYSRWPYLYIGVALGEHKLARLLKPLFLGLSRFLTPFSDNTPVHTKRLSDALMVKAREIHHRNATAFSSGSMNSFAPAKLKACWENR